MTSLIHSSSSGAPSSNTWAKSKPDAQFQQGGNTWVWVGPPSSQVWESSLVPFGLQPPLCLCPQVPGWNRWPRCRLSQTLNEFSAENMCIYTYVSRARDGRRDPVLLRHTVRWHFIASDLLFGLLSAYCQPGLSVHLLSSWILLHTSVCAVVSSLTLWCLAPESYISPLLYVLRWPALLLCLPISFILFLDSLYSWPLCHHLLPPPTPTATCNLSELQLSPPSSYRGSCICHDRVLWY